MGRATASPDPQGPTPRDRLTPLRNLAKNLYDPHRPRTWAKDVRSEGTLRGFTSAECDAVVLSVAGERGTLVAGKLASFLREQMASVRQ